MLYLRRGEDVVIAASKAGMSQHPLWYRNLKSNPEVEIEIGTERRAMRARTATAGEKAELGRASSPCTGISTITRRAPSETSPW